MSVAVQYSWGWGAIAMVVIVFCVSRSLFIDLCE